MAASVSSAKRDFYEVLGVAKDATTDDIKKAFRKLAMKHHPDKNPGDKGAEERFKEVAEAYEILSDTEKRARYDQFGHEGLRGVPTHGFSSFEEIFESFGDIFGGGGGIFEGLFGGGGGRRRGPRRGASLKVELSLTFLEAAKGVKRTIELRRFEPCTECEGTGAAKGSRPRACDLCGGRGEVIQSSGFFQIRTGCPKCQGAGQYVDKPCHECEGRGRIGKKREIEVTIPAGMNEGDKLRVAGEGEPGDLGAPPGDLYCFISVQSHEFFERDGNDILVEIPVTFSTATLGGTVEVPTIDGKTALELKPGTQSGEVVRIRGAGIPDPRGYGRGDELVRVVVDVPRKLTKKQEELLRELAKTEESNVTPVRRSFFEKLKSYLQG